MKSSESKVFIVLVSYNSRRFLDGKAAEENKKIEVLRLDIAKPADYERDYSFANLTVQKVHANEPSGR